MSKWTNIMAHCLLCFVLGLVVGPAPCCGPLPSFFALCLWTSPPRAVLVRIPLDRAIQYDTVRYPLERIPKEWHKDPIGSKWMHACTFVCIESNGKLTLVEVIFSAKTVHKNNTKYQTTKQEKIFAATTLFSYHPHSRGCTYSTSISFCCLSRGRLWT